ncbi:MAG: sulfurtransferase [Acidobacteria bacterium]|nr:MAG: sulfurtransferase [Acidobacteriota bacterium]
MNRLPMNPHVQDILRHGYLWLFLAALLERIGLPLLVTPLVIAAGAVAGLGDLSLLGIILVTVLASETGDLIWYELGRNRGPSVLRLLCKISLEPDSCVRRSEDAFARHMTTSLISSKFVPGVGRLAGPVAGMSGMARDQFLLLNGLGSLLWALVFALVGYIPARKLPIDVLLEEAAGWFLVVLVVALAANVIWKYVQRQRFIRSLRISRMTVDELKAAIDRGERPFVVDLRHKLEFLVNPRTVSSAVRISPDELSLRHAEIPRDREVVLYCTCPSEATSAKVAMELKKIGITRVRPLMGGLQAWENQGYPMDDFYHEDEAKAVS